MQIKDQHRLPFHSRNKEESETQRCYSRKSHNRTLLLEEKPLVEKSLGNIRELDLNKSVDTSASLETLVNDCNVIHYSKKLLDDVVDLYFFNEQAHNITSSISSRYLFSLFSLEYLNHLNKMVNKRYNITSLHLNDIHNTEKVENSLIEHNRIQDEPTVEWITNTCLEELSDVIDNYKIENIYQVAKLRSIINLMFNELNCGRELKNIELYDILYKFKRRLKNHDLHNKEYPLFAKYGHKITKNGECNEFTVEIRIDDQNITVPDEIVIERNDQKIILRKE